MNVAKHDIKTDGHAQINAENRRRRLRITSNGVQWACWWLESPFELTKGLEHSKVAFKDNLLRWGRLCVSQVDHCVSAQERCSGCLRGVGANGSKSLTSSLQSHSHSPLCFSAWCHPTLPCTSNEPQRLCLPLPNYKLRTRLRACCHPLKLLNYGHWHQVWKLPLSPPRSRNRPCWITQAAQIKHSP